MSPKKRALLDELIIALAMTGAIRFFLLPDAILWVLFPVILIGIHLGLNKWLQERAHQSLKQSFREDISRKDISLALAWIIALLVHGFIGLSMWIAVPVAWAVIYFSFKKPMSSEHI